MPAAKYCRIGMVNMITILNTIKMAMAKGYQLVIENATVIPAVRRRETTIVFISPNRSTTLGISVLLKIEKNLAAAQIGPRVSASMPKRIKK